MKEYLIVYHGSPNVIVRPIFGIGKKENDYGRGFYCTEHRDLAFEWAVKSHSDGYVNKYIIDTHELNFLDLHNNDYTALHWLGILIKNRRFNIRQRDILQIKKYILDNFSIPLNGVDVIRGWRADDRYFAYAKAFLHGSLSYKLLMKSMILGELGDQVVLKSANSFKKIFFINKERALSSLWFKKQKERSMYAEEQFNNLRKLESDVSDITARDIVRLKIPSEEIRKLEDEFRQEVNLVNKNLNKSSENNVSCCADVNQSCMHAICDAAHAVNANKACSLKAEPKDSAGEPER